VRDVVTLWSARGITQDSRVKKKGVYFKGFDHCTTGRAYFKVAPYITEELRALLYTLIHGYEG